MFYEIHGYARANPTLHMARSMGFRPMGINRTGFFIFVCVLRSHDFQTIIVSFFPTPEKCVSVFLNTMCAIEKPISSTTRAVDRFIQRVLLFQKGVDLLGGYSGSNSYLVVVFYLYIFLKRRSFPWLSTIDFPDLGGPIMVGSPWKKKEI